MYDYTNTLYIVTVIVILKIYVNFYCILSCYL